MGKILETTLLIVLLGATGWCIRDSLKDIGVNPRDSRFRASPEYLDNADGFLKKASSFIFRDYDLGEFRYKGLGEPSVSDRPHLGWPIYQ